MARISSNKGFTLVELAISIAILGVALTILVVLHTSYLDTFLRERNTTEAALLAKMIMTDIEISAEVPEVGEDSGELLDKLKEIGELDFDNEEFIRKIEDWRYEMLVQSISFQDIDDVLRRIDVKIIWGEGPGDFFNLVYFVRPPRK